MKKIDNCENSTVLVALLLAGILLVMGAYRLFSWLCSRGLTDTLTWVLGAAALGDIGQHFPDNDPAYKGADSLALTREVARIIAEHGYKVGNIDATILCQRPKLAPHIPAMRRNIADAFGLPVDAVSVKATTEEHLGFTGEGLGIAAHAVALIE